jgi:hypothetical protein
MRTITVILMLALAGCYNNPHKSERAPGQGNAGNQSRGPSVGPGTVPGGSTAGPQPSTAKNHDRKRVE